MTALEIISTIVSVLAIIISFRSMIITRRQGDRLLKYEETHAKLSQLSIEKIEVEKIIAMKAKIKVDIVDLDSLRYFYIHNKGQGTARQLMFELVGDNDTLLPDFNGIFPYEELKPNERIKVRMVKHDHNPLKYKVRLKWQDENNQEQVEDFTVIR